MLVVGTLTPEERERYVTRRDVAILFGRSLRTVAAWVAEWKRSQRVRLFYDVSPTGPRLKAQLDDVLRWAEKRGLGFGDTFCACVLCEAYDAATPGSRDEGLRFAFSQRGGLGPDSLRQIAEHCPPPAE